MDNKARKKKYNRSIVWIGAAAAVLMLAAALLFLLPEKSSGGNASLEELTQEATQADQTAGEASEEPSEENTGGALYEVITWEQSHTGETEGVTWTNRFLYDYISLLGEEPAYRVINRDLYSLAEESMGKIEDYDLYEPHTTSEGITEEYEKHTTSAVLHNGNGIISILISPNKAVTYSLYNGAQLGLQILTGDHQEEYLRNIQKSIEESNLWRGYVQDVSELTLGDIAFVIQDGEILVLGIGSPGRTTFTPFAEMVHTGVYITTEYTNRLQGTMQAVGGTGSAEFEIQEWDLSYRQRGYPDCLQVVIYVCEYPVLSGVPASSQMNQEIYALAEQFMTSLRQDFTETPNRFETYLECNRYWSDERISTPYAGVLYNDNGILSYAMDWYVQYSHYINGQDYIGTENYEGLYGMVYDLQTGEKLTMAEITGMDAQTQLLMLKDAYARVYNRYTLNSMRMDYDPAEFSLEDPEFLVSKEGEIVLHFTVTRDYDADYLESLPKSAESKVISLRTGMYVLP